MEQGVKLNNMDHLIQTKLESIEKMLAQQQFSQKEILTMDEAALYSGLSKSYLYKKTSTRQIPFYRLGEKLIFFRKAELDIWILKNRIPTQEEVSEKQLGSLTLKKTRP